MSKRKKQGDQKFTRPALFLSFFPSSFHPSLLYVFQLSHSVSQLATFPPSFFSSEFLSLKEEKINLKFDPNNPLALARAALSFVYKGKLGIFTRPPQLFHEAISHIRDATSNFVNPHSGHLIVKIHKTNCNWNNIF